MLAGHWKKIKSIRQQDRLEQILRASNSPRHQQAAARLLTNPSPGSHPALRDRLTDGEKMMFKSFLHQSMSKLLKVDSEQDLSARLGAASQMCRSILNLGPDQTFFPVRALSRGVASILEENPALDRSDREYALHILQWTIVDRLRSGDEAATSDYLRAIGGLHPSMDSHSLEWTFRPVIVSPENAELRNFGEQAFVQDGPWDMRGRFDDAFSRSAGSRLLLVPSFYDFVLEGLSDKSPAASAWVENGTLIIQRTNNMRHSRQLDVRDASYRESVPAFSIRQSDIFANSLASRRMNGAPKFDYLWPQQRRDSAAQEWITYLKKNHGQLRQILDASDSYPAGLNEWRKIAAL